MVPIGSMLAWALPPLLRDEHVSGSHRSGERARWEYVGSAWLICGSPNIANDIFALAGRPLILKPEGVTGESENRNEVHTKARTNQVAPFKPACPGPPLVGHALL